MTTLRSLLPLFFVAALAAPAGALCLSGVEWRSVEWLAGAADAAGVYVVAAASPEIAAQGMSSVRFRVELEKPLTGSAPRRIELERFATKEFASAVKKGDRCLVFDQGGVRTVVGLTRPWRFLGTGAMVVRPDGAAVASDLKLMEGEAEILDAVDWGLEDALPQDQRERPYAKTVPPGGLPDGFCDPACACTVLVPQEDDPAVQRSATYLPGELQEPAPK